MPQVLLKDLRVSVEKLLMYLENKEITFVDIDADFYWDVPESLRYDKYDEPTQFTVGQLSSDVEEVKRIAQEKPLLVGNSLIVLSAVLRRVGELSLF